MNPVSILMLEDNRFDAELTRAQIEKAGINASFTQVETEAGFKSALQNSIFDLILADYALPDFDGLGALEIARTLSPVTPFIFVSGTLGEDIAIQSLQNGATDYVVKHRIDRLAPAVRRALKEREERKLRVQKEAELLISESKFRNLAEALPQLIWTLDGKQNVDYCNQDVIDYIGEAEARIVPPAITVCHPSDRRLLMERWERVWKTGEISAAECRLLRQQDKSYHWHLLRFVPLEGGSGNITGYLATAMDVEEQKNRESALQASQIALRKANETLEFTVQERTKAFRRLSGQFLKLQDMERKRVARDLHDTFGQYLAVLKINLELLGQNGSAADGDGKLLRESVNILDECIREMRTTSYLLHPPMLDEAGLTCAARWYVEGFAERSGIKATLDMAPEFGRLPEMIEIVLFRVLQESLTNVLRHSRCKTVKVSLSSTQDQVELRIRDDGQGISEDRLKLAQEARTENGMGLVGMRERVEELGGKFFVDGRDHGTLICASVPLTKIENIALPEQFEPRLTKAAD